MRAQDADVDALAYEADVATDAALVNEEVIELNELMADEAVKAHDAEVEADA